MDSKLKAKDIMIKSSLALNENMSIERAVDLLTEEGISGAPVIGHSGKVVGFLSVHDVIVDLWCQYYAPNEDQIVGDLMSKTVVSIDANESVMNIVELLCIDKDKLYPTSSMGIGTADKLASISIESRVKNMKVSKPQILPVMKEGVLAGVLSKIEVIKALRHTYTKQRNIAENMNELQSA